jgi:hypothetical protein
MNKLLRDALVTRANLYYQEFGLGLRSHIVYGEVK